MDEDITYEKIINSIKMVKNEIFRKYRNFESIRVKFPKDTDKNTFIKLYYFCHDIIDNLELQSRNGVDIKNTEFTIRVHKTSKFPLIATLDFVQPHNLISIDPRKKSKFETDFTNKYKKHVKLYEIMEIINYVWENIKKTSPEDEKDLSLKYN